MAPRLPGDPPAGSTQPGDALPGDPLDGDLAASFIVSRGLASGNPPPETSRDHTRGDPTPEDPHPGDHPTGVVLHATCVAFGDRGVLILGPSGSGKSALGLQLLGLGAGLVADDRTLVTPQGDSLVASAPPGLPPLIEARGVGLMRTPVGASVIIVLAVDLGATETFRLPPRRTFRLAGRSTDLVHGPVSAHFPAAIRLYVLSGREE